MAASTPPRLPPPGASPRCNSMPEIYSPYSSTGKAAHVPNYGAQSGRLGGGDMSASDGIRAILFDGYLSQNQSQPPIFCNPSDQDPIRNYLSHQNSGLSHENKPYPIPLQDHHPNAEALLHICCCDVSKSKKKDKEQGKLYASIVVIVGLMSIVCSALLPSPAVAMDPNVVSIFGECPPPKWLITTYVCSFRLLFVGYAYCSTEHTRVWMMTR